MLGGVQWNLSDPSLPLYLFPGLCCERKSGPFDKRASSFLTMARLQWNDINNMFQHSFEETRALSMICRREVRKGQLIHVDWFRIFCMSLQQGTYHDHPTFELDFQLEGLHGVLLLVSLTRVRFFTAI